MKRQPEPTSHQPLELLSVVIPCRNEEGAIPSAVEHLHVELRLHGVPHEIVTVDDGAAKIIEPSNVIAVTMPSMIHCSKMA